MINGAFRPWGKPKWLLQMAALQDEQWLLIGTVSTQDRCLSMLRHSAHSFALGHAAFLEISEPQSKFLTQSEERRKTNRLLWLEQTKGHSSELLKYELLEPIRRLQKQVNQWTSGPFKKSIILDVSCLPERFFFPILRWLLASEEVENLIVTCMSPERYTEEDLAYDPDDWAYIQTFGPSSEGIDKPVKRVVVGAGFLPFSLPEWLKKDYNESSIQVSMLFPFPAPPPKARPSRGCGAEATTATRSAQEVSCNPHSASMHSRSRRRARPSSRPDAPACPPRRPACARRSRAPRRRRPAS